MNTEAINTDPINTKTEAVIYPFHGKTALSFGEGKTVYLSADEVIKLNSALLVCAMFIKAMPDSSFKSEHVTIEGGLE